MSERPSAQPVVLASVQRVPDLSVWRSMNEAATERLVGSGVLLRWSYVSLADTELVFTGLLVSTSRDALAMISHREVADWLARSGVDEVPPFFVGARVASLDLAPQAANRGEFIVAAIHSVPDYGPWLAAITADQERLAAQGTEQVWLYRAVDDPCEVMAMMSLQSAAAAQEMLEQGLATEAWLDQSGVPVHPPVFIGRRTELVRFPQSDGRKGLPLP